MCHLWCLLCFEWLVCCCFCCLLFWCMKEQEDPVTTPYAFHVSSRKGGEVPEQNHVAEYKLITIWLKWIWLNCVFLFEPNSELIVNTFIWFIYKGNKTETSNMFGSLAALVLLELWIWPSLGPRGLMLMGVLPCFWWGFPCVWQQHQIPGQSYHGNTLEPGFHNTAPLHFPPSFHLFIQAASLPPALSSLTVWAAGSLWIKLVLLYSCSLYKHTDK